jgi:hypothetical protein
MKYNIKWAMGLKHFKGDELTAWFSARWLYCWIVFSGET